MAKGRSKAELIRSVQNSKLKISEIEDRLSRSPKRPDVDRLLASEGSTNIRRAGIVSGMQVAKSLFSLDSLGIGKPTKT